MLCYSISESITRSNSGIVLICTWSNSTLGNFLSLIFSFISSFYNFHGNFGLYSTSFSHQFKSKCQISNFLMKKFKYLDLPQYLFNNMISYCCKQKFLYRFFIINMTRNISETNVINCYWMKLCNMVKILTCLVCCVNCICHVLHTKKEVFLNSTPQHEVKFYRGNRLHSVNSQHWLVKC